MELNFRPNVSLVSVVRRFVSEFYQRTLSDPDGTSRVALATHELLENAVKYSKDGETTLRIEVSTQTPRVVSIQLRDRAEPAHIEAIREIVDGVSLAPDAFVYYQELITRKRAARQRGRASGSRGSVPRARTPIGSAPALPTPSSKRSRAGSAQTATCRRTTDSRLCRGACTSSVMKSCGEAHPADR